MKLFSPALRTRVLAVLVICAAAFSSNAAEPLAQDYTVVLHNPDPESYVEGPGLVRLEDGALVAAVPVVPREQWSQERRVEHSVTRLLRSGDGGRTWEPLADLQKMFWATTNLSADSQGAFDWAEKGKEHGNYKANASDRRFLMLFYSLDALNWFQAGCVAQAGKLSQSFMYARPVIDGDDLAIIARSSVHAPNQHDADTATFHRVRDFRRLALKLFPKPEEN